MITLQFPKNSISKASLVYDSQRGPQGFRGVTLVLSGTAYPHFEDDFDLQCLVGFLRHEFITYPAPPLPPIKEK